MAIILVEGFDTYNGIGGATTTTVGLASRWSYNSSPLNMVAGRFGGQALQINTNGAGATRWVSVPVNGANTGTLGFAFYPDGITTGEVFIAALMYGTTSDYVTGCQIGITEAPGGIIRVYRGGSIAAGNRLIDSTFNVTLATWTYLELEFFIADSGGFVNLYANGTLIGSASGVDTRALTASDTFQYLNFGTDNASTFLNNISRWDDVYLTNTSTRLGEQRVVTVVPTSDSTPSQWSASGGAVAPYTMVDEVLCNADVDYIFDGTVGDRAVFNMASTGATPVTVNAVQLGTYSRKTDSGARSIQLQYVDGGGTAYNSSNISLASTYGRQLSLLETNPATSTAWTPSEANALKAGVRISV